jgi:hypothetical protein
VSKTAASNATSAGAWSYGNASADQFAKEDVQNLGANFDTHDHSSTKGLPVNTIPSGGLTVTAGNVGIGVAQAADRGLYIASTNLTSTTQYGAFIAHTGSSAATTVVTGIKVTASTAAAAFSTEAVGIDITNSGKGAGSTITTSYGMIVRGQTTGGTNNYGVYIEAPSGGSASNFAIKAAGVTHVGGGPSIGTTNSGLVIDNGGNDAPITNGNGISFGSLTSATASAGSNGAPPATVAGYIRINVGGTARSIPYYNV